MTFSSEQTLITRIPFADLSLGGLKEWVDWLWNHDLTVPSEIAVDWECTDSGDPTGLVVVYKGDEL